MKKEPGSLGTGIYGFLNDRELAQQFGQKANQDGDCSIIRIKVGLNEDKGLNFIDNLDDMGYFRRFLLNPKVSRQLANLRSIYRNKYKQHSLDGALIEYYINEMQREGYFSKIEYVSCATTTDIYQGLKTFIPNGIEYCIRDSNLIESIEGD
jgi:hypothetical protein